MCHPLCIGAHLLPPPSPTMSTITQARPIQISHATIATAHNARSEEPDRPTPKGVCIFIIISSSMASHPTQSSFPDLHLHLHVHIFLPFLRPTASRMCPRPPWFRPARLRFIYFDSRRTSPLPRPHRQFPLGSSYYPRTSPCCTLIVPCHTYIPRFVPASCSHSIRIL